MSGGDLETAGGHLDRGEPAPRRARSVMVSVVVAATVVASLAASCGRGGADGSVDASAARTRNVVLIVADDLGYADLGPTVPGVAASDYHDTPNLARLAASGVSFRQAYAAASVCSPSRAALLTGQYAPRTGVYTVADSARGAATDRRVIPVPNRTHLPVGAGTLASMLRAQGYRTASVGKWHLGDPAEGHGPRSHGFEVNVAGDAAGHPRTYFSPYGNPLLADGAPGEHLTARLAEEAARFVAADDPRPFFLYLSFFAVHAPIEPPPDLLARYRGAPRGTRHHRPAYAALVGAMDLAVGRVLDALDARGCRDETLVIFTSDNGGHVAYTDNAPLRAGKGTFHEGGLRVPLIVRAPGAGPVGRSVDAPVHAVDLVPTVLDAVGVAPLAGHPLDGVSLRPLLDGGDHLAERALFWHFPAYLESKGQADGPWRTTPVGVIRRGPVKLLEWFETGALELHDLAEDPAETVDVADGRRDVALALRDELRDWRERVGAPMPSPKGAE